VQDILSLLFVCIFYFALFYRLICAPALLSECVAIAVHRLVSCVWWLKNTTGECSKWFLQVKCTPGSIPMLLSYARREHSKTAWCKERSAISKWQGKRQSVFDFLLNEYKHLKTLIFNFICVSNLAGRELD